MNEMNGLQGTCMWYCNTVNGTINLLLLPAMLAEAVILCMLSVCLSAFCYEGADVQLDINVRGGTSEMGHSTVLSN